MYQLLLINVYLPSAKSADDLDELRLILNEIETFIVDADYNYAVIAGDFNCNVMQSNTASLLINDWMTTFNFTLANNLLRVPSTITYTFSGKSREAYSHIDHFYVSNKPANLVHSIKDIDANGNFSDHIPIALELDIDLYDPCKQTTNVDIRHSMVKSDNNYVNVLFDWENSSKVVYYNLTRIELNGLCNLFLNSDLKALTTVRPDIFS